MAELIYPQLSYDLMGACFDVHNELKHFDLTEAGWEKALAIALNARGIAAHCQVEFALHYKGRRIGRFFVDTIAERGEQILLELKKVPLEPIHRAKLIAYLQVTGIELGILISFAGDRVVYERIPNRIRERSALAASMPPPSLGSMNCALVEQLWPVFWEVHSELSPGFMHMHYRRACQVEMRLQRIPFDKVNEIVVRYHGQAIERHRLPFLVVDRRLMVVPLAVLHITSAIQGRYRQCLQHIGLKQGLIVNFRSETLESVVVEA